MYVDKNIQQEKEIFGHPKGLYILFFTELWERFSYYGMRALFVLFLTAKTTDLNSGFGWASEKALMLYGWYTMCVYLASIPGGWLADNVFGQKKMVMIGGMLLCLGHGILAFNSETSFYLGCILIILGVGGLKPNISSMVGGLYKKGDERRNSAFFIFYTGINIGGAIAPILCGLVGEKINWHYGFGLAAIGMCIGQIVFFYGRKYLKGIGEHINRKDDTNALAKKPLTSIEKDRMLVLIISFLLVIIFWGAFEQAGGLMNLYAQNKTDRMFYNWEVPASWFQSLNSIFIVLFAVLVGKFWVWQKHRGKEASSIFKIALGILIMGWGFIFMTKASIQYEESGSSAMYWLILAYLFHTIGELCSSPVALSFITKLAPLKYASSMMGIYFAATGLGNFLASKIGVYSERLGETQIFLGLVMTCTVIFVLIFLLLKPLKRLTHGADD